MHHVHAVISDKGWILETLAKELADRLPYVSYDLHPDRSAALQYYITYGARVERVSPKEIALFTHLEADPTARAKFFDVARAIDCAVAMSRAASTALVEEGHEKVEIISPGVDFDRFHPVLRVGVVGRTYHTGRKGEALVNALPKIDGIEFVFTGDGWPGPAMRVPEAGMPDFYRTLDYVLVPASNEGGPMCVLEALSCGVPIIGSDVGWVADFPHIPFEAGNAASLTAVLKKLREEKFALRRSVADRTWDAWATRHDQLFKSVLGTPLKSRRRKPAAQKDTTTPRHVTLLTHGSEGQTQGGPSIRVPKTAKELRKLGIDARAGTFPSRDALDGELVHLFNVWTPHSAVTAARRAKAADKALAFSPILLDLSELSFWNGCVLARLRDSGASDSTIDRLLRDYRSGCGWQRLTSPEPGFRAQVSELAQLSDNVIFLSEHERNIFRELSGSDPASCVVRNPVDAITFADADPELFREYVGLTEFVLCVARLEPRKNQLLLLRAAKELGLPVVLVGHSGAHWYDQALREYASNDVRFVGRLDHSSALLRSAFAACRVFALPSWAEGAPLAALEAASSGANLVLSSRSGEREYFGDLARYADPADLEQLTAALHEAWFDPQRDARVASLKSLVQSRNSWGAYAHGTAEAYKTALINHADGRRSTDKPSQSLDYPKSESGARTNLVVDVTTSLNHGALRSGITRVEAALSQALISNCDVHARFVVWMQGHRRFVEIPSEIVRAGSVRAYLEMGPPAASAPPLPIGGQMLVVGSSWMQNSVYAEALSDFAAQQNLALNVVIHDLTPVYWTHWYPKGYSPVFTSNLKTILNSSDRLLTYSASTARDISRFAAESALDCPPIASFKLASEIDDNIERGERRQGYEAAPFGKSSFVLVVGAIHRRKNYELLYDCWIELKERLGQHCPHLVIVGGVSWNGEEIARALTEDQRLAGLVHILTGVDDDKLSWLYEHCTVTAYPSLYEGWGLPVAESLAYGKVCIASNTSSVPEIAPDLTDLIDPTDRRNWTARILHYVTSASSRQDREKQIREGFVPVSWARSASTLVAALKPDVPEREDRFLYNLGAVCDLSQSAWSHKLRGWHTCETFGSWSSASDAVLRFDIRPLPVEDLMVVAKLRSLDESSHSASVTLLANGHEVIKWDAGGGPEALRCAVIPRTLIGLDGRLELTFRASRVEMVRRVIAGSSDLREIGIGVLQVQVLPRSAAEEIVLSDEAEARLGPLIVETQNSAANDDALVRSPAAVRLRLPGLPSLTGPMIAIAAEPNVSEGEQNAEALVLLNGRTLGVMRQSEAPNRLHYFRVPAEIAELQDPAVLEVVQQGPHSNGLQEWKVFGAAAFTNGDSRPLIRSETAWLDLTDPRMQLRGASALIEDGGASGAGVRLAGEAALQLRLPSCGNAIALIQTSKVAPSDELVVRAGVPEADWSSTFVCSEELNVLDVPHAGETLFHLANRSSSRAIVQRVEVRELLPLEAGLLLIAAGKPEFLVADGFHGPESDGEWSGRWSNRPESTLYFRAPSWPVNALELQLEAAVCGDEGLTVRVNVDNAEATEIRLEAPGPFSCGIEASLAAGSLCRLTIGVDRMFIPSEHGFPADDRILGVFVRSVRCVSEAEMLKEQPILRLA